MVSVITTALEVAGVLIIVAGISLAVAAWSVPGALVTSGALLIGTSMILSRLGNGEGASS